MDATEDGIEIWVNFEHPLNVPSSIFFIEEESSIWCKDAHLLNAYSPIEVTEGGITILRNEQLLNANFPIDVNEGCFSKVICLSDELSKAFSPKEETEEGILIIFNDEQSLKT